MMGCAALSLVRMLPGWHGLARKSFRLNNPSERKTGIPHERHRIGVVNKVLHKWLALQSGGSLPFWERLLLVLAVLLLTRLRCSGQYS